MTIAERNFSLKEEIRAYWSERAADFDLSPAHRIEERYGVREWRRFLRKAFGLGRAGGLDGRHVLDIACGTGEISRVLTGLGAEVTGVDFSETMLARAREKLAGRGWTGIHADAEALFPLADGSFDFAVTRHLAWTLTDPAAAFAEWRRVLKPGGALLVIDGDWVTPHSRWWKARRWLALRLGAKPEARSKEDSAVFQSILRRLPYRAGLKADILRAELEAAGFTQFRELKVNHLYGRGMRGHGAAERLLLSSEYRFAIVAS